MATWNYRIIRYRDGGGFGLHEVYYDAAGLPWAMTESAATFACDADEGAEGIRGALAMATSDACQRPILDEPDTWPGTPPGDQSAR